MKTTTNLPNILSRPKAFEEVIEAFGMTQGIAVSHQQVSPDLYRLVAPLANLLLQILDKVAGHCRALSGRLADPVIPEGRALFNDIGHGLQAARFFGDPILAQEDEAYAASKGDESGGKSRSKLLVFVWVVAAGDEGC